MGLLPPPPQIVEVPVIVQAPAEANVVGFDHAEAQKFELEHNSQTIREHFERVYAEVEHAKATGHLWQHPDEQWFQGDAKLFDEYVAHARTRKNLEIGSGPFGHIAPCYWMEDRAIIDPLIDDYRRIQLEQNGKTFFPPEIATFAANAETLIPELVGKVDGSVISRNALDHCEDPLSVLYNMSLYAAPGAWLILWTDIWHLDGLDAGHHNITKSEPAFVALLNGLGFDIIKRGATIREGNDYLEYGCLARKRG